MKWANDEEHFARHIAADLRADGKPSLSQHFRRAPLPRSLKQRFSARHLFGETHGGPWVRIDSERFPLPVLAFSKADVLRVSDSLDRVRRFQNSGRVELMTITTMNRDATEPGTVLVHGSAAGFAQAIAVGRHQLTCDEPAEVGGTDTGPTPYDLLLAALGSCTSMTVAMYARRKRWPLEAVTVRLRHSKIHAADCEGCETKEGRLDHIERAVELTGVLSDDQRARLLDIANKCPVHRTLMSEIHVETRLTIS